MCVMYSPLEEECTMFAIQNSHVRMVLQEMTGLFYLAQFYNDSNAVFEAVVCIW